MQTGRLEAFSDGVLAIIITIMVLEMKVPEGADFTALKPLFPVFVTYIISFIHVGIYWNNHHHLLHLVGKVTGGIMWANLNLLFWLSLFPFATGWMGENHFEQNTVALYGIILMMAGVAYRILVYFAIKSEGENSVIKKAFGKDFKGNISIIIYLAGVAISFFYPLVSLGFYILVGATWFIPDKRVEKNLNN